MTTKRLAILFAVLLGGMGSVLLLPKQLGFQPAGINLDLPKMVGGWYGIRDLEITPQERGTLGPETEFARKVYRNGRGYELIASIVLSGQDMNTSIHRPERCMPAQGFTVIDKHAVPVSVGGSEPLRVTRLQSVRNTPAVAGEEAAAAFSNVTYYWFIGHTDSTGSHLYRTWLDIRDRLIYGYNQRWAYVTVAASLPPGAEKDPQNLKLVDGWAQEFIKQLVPKIQKGSEAVPVALGKL